VQDRILVPHGDHRAAERDALGVLAGGGEERERGGEVVVEMALVGPAGPVPEPLGRLEQRYAVTQAAPGALLNETRVEAEPQAPATCSACFTCRRPATARLLTLDRAVAEGEICAGHLAGGTADELWRNGPGCD
jgi:hypothetical protein